MLFSRYLPIVAPIALAAYLGAKKESPFGLGTLRDDSLTFGILLIGTILIVGALLFLPLPHLDPWQSTWGDPVRWLTGMVLDELIMEAHLRPEEELGNE